MTSSQFPNFYSERARNSTLGDGVYECAFGHIPALLESLDSFFSERSLTPDTTLALQTTNSVPGAIVLLWLIQHNFRFFLVPPTQKNESVWENIPAFCSFLITIEEGNLDAFTLDSPPWNRLLRAEATAKSLKGENGTLQHPEGMLYLRTSGSMGKSKIVSYTLDNLWAQARNSAKHYEFSHQDRVMIPVPVFHLYGLMRAFLPALIGGASVEVQKNSNLIKYLGSERRFRPNIAFLTPSLCEMLYKGKRDNKAYRLIVTGGQSIQQKLFEAFDTKFGGALVNSYGSSEMGMMTSCKPHDPIELKCLTVGKPLPGVEILVKETQDGLQDAEATSGNGGGLLFVRNPCAFSGYVADEGNFKVKHEPDQWFRTGDCGVVNPDGYLRVLGRADNRVNRSGYLVSLSEIETRMGELPQLSTVVVLALEEESQRGQTLVAVCVLDTKKFNDEPSASIDSTIEKIQQNCHEILRPYAVPDRILVFPSLPSLPSGKIDRQSLKLMVNEQLGKQDALPANGRHGADLQPGPS